MFDNLAVVAIPVYDLTLQLRGKVTYLSVLEGLDNIYVVTFPQTVFRKQKWSDKGLPKDFMLLQGSTSKENPSKESLFANEVIQGMEVEYKELEKGGWKGTIPEVLRMITSMDESVLVCNTWNEQCSGPVVGYYPRPLGMA